MLSYVFMKILEARPASYDRRIDRVDGGRSRAARQAVQARVADGSRVLEIGCGPGTLARSLAQRGCTVDAFDANRAMIEEARSQAGDLAGDLADHLHFRFMGVDGMDRYQAGAYDAVVSTLVLSELSDDERHYALGHVARVLRRGGLLLLAVEVPPTGTGARALHALARAPAVATTWLITGSSTRPVQHLRDDLAGAGLVLDDWSQNAGSALAVVVAHRPEEA
ncbi:MAG: class I SAM-dependent methyltransferase [Oligoflexia bacterium]|nr:class I SAM-dependent methyltransferase [Oligoflexia bacterium]